MFWAVNARKKRSNRRWASSPGNAHAGVPNLEVRRLVCRDDGDEDVAFLRRELDRIREQVVDHLREPRVVGAERRSGTGNVEMKQVAQLRVREREVGDDLQAFPAAARQETGFVQASVLDGHRRLACEEGDELFVLLVEVGAARLLG
jgi:hypothetical protein